MASTTIFIGDAQPEAFVACEVDAAGRATPEGEPAIF